MNFQVRFDVDVRLKCHHYYIPMLYINSIFSLFFAGVFGVHSLIRIPSLCQTLHVILRWELSII